MKYGFNNGEEIFVDHLDYVEVIRGGEGNHKSGFHARLNEIQSSFLSDISEYFNKFRNEYFDDIEDALGYAGIKTYREFVFDYVNKKDPKFRSPLETSIHELLKGFIRKKYRKLYCRDCVGEGIQSFRNLDFDSIESILKVNEDYFNRIIDSADEFTFIHRGQQKRKPYRNKSVYIERKLITSYSFSISVAESFATFGKKGLQIPEMIGIEANEIFDRIFAMPMFFDTLPAVHHKSYELLLIPPLEEIRIYQDISPDGASEYVILNENSKYFERYIAEIERVTGISI
ncbi:hypothetical protein LEP1GSC050_0112 [Leptospira broomii serovar Hurstbridge str. 5399]|uniref:Uncharacterized protein n=1 Tax=Leptospira broomii serovar Hurstbridge str. 5399 TaxID=1049789 RepID=T0FFB3_9LEPT|nr:hypothetical protein LEP1GSC050_0112 [Leptospira broomii serovar Hurstbridge str. 5399]